MHHVCINTLKCSDLAFSLPRGGVSTIIVPARLLLSSCCLPLFPYGEPRGKCVSMTHSLFIASSFQNPCRLLHNRHVSTSCCRRRRRIFLPFQNAGWEAREGHTPTATAISQIPPAPSNPPT